MPQQLYWVKEKETGQTFQMHSVDAAEGMALGDYVLIDDPEKELTPEERRSAAVGHRAPGAFPHPELQTPEQRAETRRLVKAQAEGGSGAGSPPLTQAPAIAASNAPAETPSRRSTGPGAHRDS